MFEEDNIKSVNVIANDTIDDIYTLYRLLGMYNATVRSKDKLHYNGATLRGYDLNKRSKGIEFYSISYLNSKYNDIISEAEHMIQIIETVSNRNNINEGLRSSFTNNTDRLKNDIKKMEANKQNIIKYSKYMAERIEKRELKKTLEDKKINQAKIDAEKIKQVEADSKKITEIDSDINKKAETVTEQAIKSEVQSIDKNIKVAKTELKKAKKSKKDAINEQKPLTKAEAKAILEEHKGKGKVTDKEIDTFIDKSKSTIQRIYDDEIKQKDLVIKNLEKDIKQYNAQKKEVKSIPQKIKGIIAKIVQTFRKLININSDGSSNIKGVVVSTAIIAAGYSIIYGIMKSMKNITLKAFYNVKDTISNIIRVILSPSSYGYVKSILVMIISALTLTGITGLIDTVVRMLKGKFKK